MQSREKAESHKSTSQLWICERESMGTNDTRWATRNSEEWRDGDMEDGGGQGNKVVGTGRVQGVCTYCAMGGSARYSETA